MIAAVETEDFLRVLKSTKALGPMQARLWAEIDLSAIRRQYPQGALHEQVEQFTRYRVELQHGEHYREVSPWQDRPSAEAYILGLQDGFELGRPVRKIRKTRRLGC